MNKWLKEPLLHFLLIGSTLLGVYALVNPDDPSFSDNRIVISSGDIERLSANWSKGRNRHPTEAESQVLIDSYIREEIYYREAVALGLDRNDTILRRRMVQKMEFLSSDLADLKQPDEATINQYFQENLGKYELPARISFSHIYFSAAKRGEHIYDDVEKALADVRARKEINILPWESGDSFMLQHVFTLEAPFEIVRIFGQGFAESIFQLQANNWQGPVESGYGLHLVRVNEKIDASIPKLASVIDQVRNDWILEQRQKVNKEIYERFRQRYEIVVEDRENQDEQSSAVEGDGKST